MPSGNHDIDPLYPRLDFSGQVVNVNVDETGDQIKDSIYQSLKDDIMYR
jgi:hypothetical protein